MVKQQCNYANRIISLRETLLKIIIIIIIIITIYLSKYFITSQGPVVTICTPCQTENLRM